MITAPSMWATARKLKALSFLPVAAVHHKLQAAGWSNTGVERAPDGLTYRLMRIACAFSIAKARNTTTFTCQSPQTLFLFTDANTSQQSQFLDIQVAKLPKLPVNLRKMVKMQAFLNLPTPINSYRNSSFSRAMCNNKPSNKNQIWETTSKKQPKVL